jgi:23S rRNA (adenine2503-C2)-methyltransferase
MGKTIATEYDLTGLQDLLSALGVERYRARQIFHWLYGRGTLVFEEMSNLPSAVSHLLRTHGIEPVGSTVGWRLRARDATEKCAVRLGDGHLVEFVVIRHGRRNTLCVSTQVGCAVGCVFCASGARGLIRNLTAGEIAEQYVHALSALFEGERISNIVLMGMGEPMLNLANVLGALERLHAPWGANIGLNRITVSTIGYVAGIRKLAGSGLAANLAISLHAPSDEIRRELVPHGPQVSVRDLVAAGTEYRRTTGKDVSVEYVLIGGTNSRLEHARALAKLLRRTGIKANLILYNPLPELLKKPAVLRPAGSRCRCGEEDKAGGSGPALARPSVAEVSVFLRELERRAVRATVRASRGGDISAACGQLAVR